MHVRVISGRELSPDLTAAWSALTDCAPALASPYFQPDFTAAVAAVRDDVYVGVIEDGSRPVGFLPFQRGRFGVGKPVGGALSDFHGLIARPDLDLPATELLRGCGLATWDFTHLPAEQRTFAPYHAAHDESHYMDLSGGFEAYAERLRERGSHVLKEVRQKRRKIERECGTLRFVAHTPDVGVLRQLLAWKSSQYQRSGLVDVFHFAWTQTLLEQIHATQTPGFSGMLSALYINDELAAAHMGMRSRRVWNWWFPRHDERFARYSPGIVLRICAAEAAAEHGVTRIDLGMGGENTYKPRLRTDGIPVAQGRVELPSLVVAARRLRRSSEAWVRRSPLAPLARVPGRLFTRLERWRRFR
jgi:CelD/BcsL family acetyltransferase involved in cellulose biosynthesis